MTATTPTPPSTPTAPSVPAAVSPASFAAVAPRAVLENGARVAPVEPAVTTVPAEAVSAVAPLSSKARCVRQLARCPACGAPVVFDRAIICTNVHCGAQYRLAANGLNRPVPELLTPADRSEAAQLMTRHGIHTVPAFGSRALRFFAPPPPSPCFDPDKDTRLREFFGGFAAEAVLLDIGAQNFNLHPTILNFDMAPFNHTDLIGNAHRLPLPDEAIDGIVNTGVLEHVSDPDQVVREMVRVLKPGGRVYIETPFLQGEHPDPLDFRRYTLDGLRRQCTQFGLEIRAAGMGCGPGSTWAWIARESVAALFGGRRSFTAAWAWAGWATFWLKYLDLPFRRRPYIHRLASSYFVIAAKPAEATALAAPAAAPEAIP